MNNAKKLFTIFTIGLVMMCCTLYAQVYERLPDNFTEKYSSLDAYYKAQEEEVKKREEQAKAALEAKQKGRAEINGKCRIYVAFYNNDKTETMLQYKKMFGGYFEIYSNEPYDEAYVVWRQDEDNEYSYTIWQLEVGAYNKCTPCVLIHERLESISDSYHKMLEIDESSEDTESFMNKMKELCDKNGWND